MAQGVAIKRGSTFYAINLASWKEDVDATTTRIHWSCNIQFGNWYLWGVRLHVAIDGHEVGPWDGACTYRGQVVINVSGTRDIARGDAGRDIKVEAWSESRTVNGYGGVGITTSCHEWQNAPAIPYEVPKSPSDMTAWRNSDRQNGMRWKNNPEGVVKKYTQLKVTRTVDGGEWRELKVLNPDAKGNLPTSFTDNDVYANHRYRYAVHAANNAGWTAASHSDYVYTTPSAPSGCGASRSSDTQAKVWWRLGERAEHTYVNVLLERRTDEGGWTQIATLGSGTTNYTDNGISSNHRYDYRVRAYNGLYSDYSTQQDYIYTTPAAPKSVRLGKIGGTKVRITVESGSRYAEDFRYQVSVNDGPWSNEAVMGASVDVDAGGGAVKARVRSRRGNLYSAYTYSGSVTTIVPPNAPTLGEFASVYALPATVRVEWTRSHPDGTDQTAAQVEVTDPAGGVTTVDVGTAPRADIKLDKEGEYRVRARTKGLDQSWGAWSPQSSIHAENRPQAFFTTPSVDGVVVQGVPFTVEWDIETSSGVSSQEIRLLSASGDVLHSAMLAVSARSYTFSVDTYLPQTLKDYTISLVALDGYSLSAEARRRVRTDYAEPAIPHIDVVNDPSDMSAHVRVLQGEAGWVMGPNGFLVSPEYWDGSRDNIPVSAGFKNTGNPNVAGIGTVVPTVRLSVARLLEDGSQEMLSDDLPSGHEVIDRLPPLNVDYTYLVTAYSAAGTATTAEITAHVDSDGFEAFNFGVDAGRALLLGLDADASVSTSLGGEWFEFIDGSGFASLPAFYPDGSMSASGSHSYIVTTADDYREIDAIRRDRSNAVCWFRDHWGGRHRVKADWTLGYSAKSYAAWNVSASLTEAMWEGPRNG